MTEDRISALPDGVRQLILSLLPAHEAVRTSVLARSWRNLWTRSHALHITWWGAASKFSEFMSGLLRRRGLRNPDTAWAPLDSCYFDIFDSDTEEEITTIDKEPVGDWIQCALCCEVRELRFCFRESEGERLDYQLHDWALASKHLAKLELSGVSVFDEHLDFSGCPALLDLEIFNSYVVSGEIWSPSLQHLSITYSDLYLNVRTRIRTPCLVSLTLLECWGRTPFLGRIPSLESAAVEVYHSHYMDQCFDTSTIHGCGEEDKCEGCKDYYGPNNDRRSCVVLSGLSEATNLTLSAPPQVFVFSRDMKCCPTFWNLKTLVLKNWFVANSFSGLVGFLKHSPILEKLTLQLSEGHINSARTEGRCKPLDPSFVSDRLKTVEIKCHEVDAMVIEILNILAASGVPLEQINIQSSTGSGRAKFKCIGLSK